VGVDHNGTVYIYDVNNFYIRIVEAPTKIMRTMIHGACRFDSNTHEPMMRVPFQLEVRAMVCFRSWIKYYGEPTDHIVKLPKEIEDLEPDKRIDPENPYGDKVIVEEEEKPEVKEEKKDGKEIKTVGGDEADADGGEEGEGDGDGESEKEVTPEMLQAYHKRECPYYEEHPLIKEKDFFEFKDNYIDMIVEKTA